MLKLVVALLFITAYSYPVDVEKENDPCHICYYRTLHQHKCTIDEPVHESQLKDIYVVMASMYNQLLQRKLVCKICVGYTTGQFLALMCHVVMKIVKALAKKFREIQVVPQPLSSTPEHPHTAKLANQNFIFKPCN